MPLYVIYGTNEMKEIHTKIISDCRTLIRLRAVFSLDDDIKHDDLILHLFNPLREMIQSQRILKRIIYEKYL